MHEKQRSRLPLRWAKETRTFKYRKMYVLGKNEVVLRKRLLQFRAFRKRSRLDDLDGCQLSNDALLTQSGQ